MNTVIRLKKGLCLAVLSMNAVVPASAQDGGIQFATPLDGQVVRPGESLAVVLDVDPSLGATWANVVGRGFEWREMEGPPFETTITIPLEESGPMYLIAAAAVERIGPSVGAVEVRLNVIPADPPIAIDTMQDALSFRLSTDPVRPARIGVVGDYADGSSRRLSYPGMGTTFESSDKAVAVVDEEGRVRAVAPGIAVITVRNGAASAWVAVSVDDDTDRRVPPVDQTAKVAVSGSGFRFDPVSELFTQQVTVVNRSQEPLVRPLVLVLDELTPGVTVRSQVTRELHPVGAPWVGLTDGLGVLAPGALVTIDVQFRNPQGVPITYTPIVYSARHPI